MSGRRGRLPACLATAWMALALIAAAPPEVVSLRVPADRVNAWFPPGVELKRMPADDFRALVRAAGKGAMTTGERPARLLRVLHEAKWVDGRLVGKSTLTVAPPDQKGSGEIPLGPWTPAVVGANPLRASDDGGVTVRVGPSADQVTLSIPWELRARPGSRGRSFALGLPSAGIAELRLELPESWRPDGAPGLRRGPVGSTWSFLGGGPQGRTFDLVLNGPQGEMTATGDNPRLWCEETARLDVTETDARWRSETTYRASPRLPREVTIELGPALELLRVSGPAVEGFRPEGDRVAISLGGERSETTVVVEALTRVPAQGAWDVPSVRAVESVWTGGTTTIRLDPSRVVTGLTERAGRRVAARGAVSATSPATADDRVFVFEGSRPGSVASFTLREPTADVSAEVHGEVVVGNASPRLTCQVTWLFRRGRPLGLDVELPPAWSPERVELEGSTESLAWFPEVLPGGGVRLRVSPPSRDGPGSSVVLNISANASVAGGRGALSLPRVRPVGVTVADEVWVCRVEPGLAVRPTLARGIAWLDPDRAAPTDPEVDTPRAPLAWRWVEDAAEARVERERVAPGGEGSVREVASIEDGRLRVDARLAPAAREGSVLVGVIGPGVDPSVWRFFDDATGAEIVVRPLERGKTSGLGDGPAWALPLSQARAGGARLRARYEAPWTGDGEVPLLVMPEGRGTTEGTLVVRLARDLRSTLKTRGVRTLDPEAAASGFETTDSPADRRAHAFAYADASAAVGLTTETLGGGPTEVIRDATLRTAIDPSGLRRDRLTLWVAHERAATLELTLPDGATLDRVRREGQPVTPTRSGNTLVIPLTSPGPTSGPSRPLTAFTLDYHTPRPFGRNTITLRPDGPTFSMPCLALLWEVEPPRSWRVAGWGEAWVPADPRCRPRGLAERLGLTLTDRPAASTETEAAAMLRDLDARALANRPEEVGLGDWLTRWDAGAWPVVIDRVALDSAGYGPRSRLIPTRPEAGKPGAASAMLRPLGLTVKVAGRAFLITTTEGADEPALALAESVATAAGLGSDPSDRYQSVACWREESTPRGSALPEDPRGPAACRFAATGWPRTGDEVLLIDQTHEAALGGSAALAVLAVGVAAGLLIRRRPPTATAPARGRAVPLLAPAATLGLGLALIATALAPERLAAVASGATYGTLGLILLGLGAASPLPRFRPGRTAVPVRRLATGVGLLLAFALGAGAVDVGQPIVVLYPYAGVADPDTPPDRAVLRLDDFLRLQALADPTPRPIVPTLRATDAVHRVSRHEADLTVTSEYTLEADLAGAASWEFPVSDSRDISATVDGLDAPVAIRPAGKSASVPVVAKGGTCRVVIRRTLTLKGESVGLAVNRVPSASVRVERPGPMFEVHLPSCRGEVVPEAGAVVGRLGPADRLEVRWSGPGTVKPDAPSGTVEGLALWDATPAGDRLRARLTFRTPSLTSFVRFAVPAGVLVREANVSGMTDSGWEGTADRRVWVARVDPPLADGAVATFDLWKSLAAGAESDGPRDVREPPWLEPLGVDRGALTLGFRRPPDWSGRVAAEVGADVLGEEAFVRAWGNLPAEPFTLSGAVRLTPPFGRRPFLSVATAPRPRRQRVTQGVTLDVVPGRVELTAEVELTETEGADFEAEAALPDGFRPISVTADGLTDWSVVPPHTLRVRFDGPEVHRRRLRLVGQIPLSPEPSTIPMPWPKWGGEETDPGTLTVRGPGTVVLAPGSGVRPLSALAGIAGALPTYRVERLADGDRLRVEPEPPRVAVEVLSQVTIDPDSAEWMAAVRYDVSGGPLDAINLKLPAEWAATASVRLEGVGHQLSEETRGDSTQWLIRPDHPIWGSAWLFIRAALPFADGSSRTFPELSPLGRGGADRYLRIVNATSGPVVVSGSAGLQPIAPASFPTGERLAPAVRGTATHAYHVVKNGWTLRLQKPAAPPTTGVSHVELTVTLAPDGSALGLARADLARPSRPFLGVTMPGDATPLWSALNGQPARPLQAGAGRWAIPLSDGAHGRLVLVWKSGPTAANGPIPLPRLGDADAPVVVTVASPVGVSVVSRDARLVASEPAALDLKKAGWTLDETAANLGRIDRSDRKEGEDLVASLVRFGLALRQAERASPRVRPLAEALRVRLDGELQVAALDPFGASARVHLGLAPESPTSTAATPDPPRSVLVRPLGRLQTFEGTLDARADGPPLAWSAAPRPGTPGEGIAGRLALGLTPALAAAWLAGRAARRIRWLAPVLLASALAALVWGLGPFALLAGSACAAVGRLARSRQGPSVRN